MKAAETADSRPEVVGVLGGTFDPVHLGHIHAATWVRKVLPARRVFLIPCATPPHKNRPRLSSAGHRVAMLRLATEGLDWLEVRTLEVDRGGVSYTIDTLRALVKGSPPLRPIFILGMDALREIHTWRSHTDLIREFDLVAVDRPGGSLETVQGQLEAEVASRLVAVSCQEGAAARLEDPPPGDGGRIYHLPILPVPVSSSQVRARVGAGASLDGLVPLSVARYIQDQELYQQEEPR